MLHILYIFAFTIVAFLAITNLIRNLIVISTESNRRYSNSGFGGGARNRSLAQNRTPKYAQVSHPELLDENGRPIDEPLLVMRSVTVEDAREKLDAIYNSSPSSTREADEER